MPRRGTRSVVVQPRNILRIISSIIAASGQVASGKGRVGRLGQRPPLRSQVLRNAVSTTNAVVLQSGGCTPVLNRSLWGVVRSARESGAFGEVYGARRGS